MKTKAALFSLRALTTVIPLTAPLAVPLVFFQAVPPAEARENSLSGGGSINYEFYDRSGGDSAQPTGQAEAGEATAPAVQPDTNDNYSRIIINPVLTIKSLGDKNAIDLTYSPSLVYGGGNDGDLQQMVKISANWAPTSRWTVAISDNYQQTDTDLDNINRAGFTPQPATTEGGQAGTSQTSAGTSQAGTGSSQTSQTVNSSQLSDQPGHQQYATNLLHTEATYEYWEDSFFNFGYEFEQLRYDNLIGANQDYDKHSVFASINHRLNSQYRLSAQARYVQGKSDEAAAPSNPDVSDPAAADGTLAIDDPGGRALDASASGSSDVNEFHINTSIESLVIPHHPLSLAYSLDSSSYDDERQADSQIHTLLLGWTWEMSEKSKFTLSAGPVLEKTDGGDDSWSYAINTSYNRQWSALGQITFSAAHGAETRNFSGNQNDNGMTEYWRAGVNVSQALTENLALNFMATVADENVTGNTSPTESELENNMAGGDRNTRQYTLGGGLNYNFARWYSLGLNYSYTTQDGDLPADNYDEHRVMLVLSMQRDFFHW